MRRWGSKDKSLDNLSDRLDRLEEERGEVKPVEDNDANDSPYATAEELEQMNPMERYVAWFNWHVREIMSYYKAEVMRLHNITSDEYNNSTLEGDRSIYLPQPKPMFEPTHYDERVAHVLGLNYQELQDKFKQGELGHKIAGCDITGRDNHWRDEDPNAVF
ncbi:MAG: hypothetical protein ACRD4W_04410 [Nitrososphaeraceae archaeon]